MAPIAEADAPAAPAAGPDRPTPQEYFAHLGLRLIQPSKTNPRTHFPDAYIDELATSIREKGLVQPIIVREIGASGKRYEIVAGECRYRASRKIGLEHIPAIVRPYSDEEVLEVQLIENIHRTDLTALEQAVGYRRLIDTNPTKHSAESIAQRIGMSPAWVWDRLKLNDLVPEAKMLLEEDYISTGHAILIARLKPEDQKRIIAVDEERNRGAGLWRDDAGFDWDESDPANGGKRRPNKWEGLKTCSVRELEAYIRDHVRFDVHHAAKSAPLEFEQVAERVDAAAAKPGRGKKVIAITFEHYVQPEARTEDERTYGPRSFKLADGKEHLDDYTRRKYFAHTCEHAVLGVVAAGERYGEALEVCIARDKCEIHWKKAIAEKRKPSGDAGQAKKREADRREAEERRRQAEERREAAERKAWQQAAPEIVVALAAKVRAAKPSTIGPMVLRDSEVRYVKGAIAQLGTPKTADDFLRIAVFIRAVAWADNSYWGPRNMPKFAKAFGLNIAPILQKHRDAATTPAKPKAGKKR